MRVRVIPLGLMLSLSASAAPTAEQWQLLVKGRPEADEIQWKDPARGALKVRIVQATGRNLTVEKTLPAGVTSREIPLSELARISFALTPREASLHREPTAASVPALRVYWETRRSTVEVPGSNAPQTGLALAKALRVSGETRDLDEADRVLDDILAHDNQKPRIELARAEQMTVEFTRLLKSGKIEEADRCAWKITEAPDNPDGMLLATAFLAERHFSQLKEIEKDNPRWMDDEEVRPVRSRTYQLALDFSLYPSLFLGSRAEEAANGLGRAARIYQFTGETSRMKGALEDLAALYPESGAAKETADQLARLRRPEAAGAPGVPATTAPDAPAETESNPTPEPPPPARRYNIFGD